MLTHLNCNLSTLKEFGVRMVNCWDDSAKKSSREYIDLKLCIYFRYCCSRDVLKKFFFSYVYKTASFLMYWRNGKIKEKTFIFLLKKKYCLWYIRKKEMRDKKRNKDNL